MFLALLNFTGVVKRFVYREGSSDSSHTDTDTFVAQSQSLVQLCPILQEPASKQLASVLISARKSCRKCGKALKVEEKRVHVVVIYHSERGSYLGSRVIKNWRRCRVYEHYAAFGWRME